MSQDTSFIFIYEVRQGRKERREERREGEEGRKGERKKNKKKEGRKGKREEKQLQIIKQVCVGKWQRKQSNSTKKHKRRWKKMKI